MCKLIDELQDSKHAYMAAVSKIEDSIDPRVKKEASEIIETTIIHENIALEEIQN